MQTKFPFDNTITAWILSCTCDITRCNYLEFFWPEVVYIKGAIFEETGPLLPTSDLPIQITNVIFTHIDQTIQTKIDNCDFLIEAIKAQSLKINPLTFIIAKNINLRETLHWHVQLGCLLKEATIEILENHVRWK